jgi:hypothetical protein
MRQTEYDWRQQAVVGGSGVIRAHPGTFFYDNIPVHL